jgi:hypothetical protein
MEASMFRWTFLLCTLALAACDGSTGPRGAQGPQGSQGPKGDTGDMGASVVAAAEPPGANCANGGSGFTVGGATTYACSAPTYVGMNGVTISGNVISFDTTFGDARYALTVPDAGGPRVSSATFDMSPLDGTVINLVLTAPVLPGTLASGAFSVSTRDPSDASNGWVSQTIASMTVVTIGVDPGIQLTLSPAIASPALVRVIVKGTGPTPLLGSTNVPFAGAVGGKPATADEGVDYVKMFRL